jgi:hypothetical protein
MDATRPPSIQIHLNETSPGPVFEEAAAVNIALPPVERNMNAWRKMCIATAMSVETTGFPEVILTNTRSQNVPAPFPKAHRGTREERYITRRLVGDHAGSTTTCCTCLRRGGEGLGHRALGRGRHRGHLVCLRSNNGVSTAKALRTHPHVQDTLREKAVDGA